jgi:hypothetical protein
VIPSSFFDQRTLADDSCKFESTFQKGFWLGRVYSATTARTLPSARRCTLKLRHASVGCCYRGSTEWDWRCPCDCLPGRTNSLLESKPEPQSYFNKMGVPNLLFEQRSIVNEQHTNQFINRLTHGISDRPDKSFSFRFPSMKIIGALRMLQFSLIPKTPLGYFTSTEEFLLAVWIPYL